MEVSFSQGSRHAAPRRGETFHGEGILAITKALLQSGVAYVGGYQGAPVSHLLDVLVQAKDYLAELGVHVEACANEASAAAMLGASIHYPLRGAVTWKSIVGTNVAADALSNLASPGVTGGALIIVGEDYGEGASVIQERTYAYALKSSLVLLDPRPELAHMVRIVEHAFALSEASNMPAVLQLRIRACHVRGSVRVPRQRAARGVDAAPRWPNPRRSTTASSRIRRSRTGRKSARATSACRPRAATSSRMALNERLRRRARGPRPHRAGRALQLAGARAAAVRARRRARRARAARCSRSTSSIRWCPTRSPAFCRGKRAVLVLEEGQPEFIEQEIARDPAARGRRHAHRRQGRRCRWPANTRSR